MSGSTLAATNSPHLSTPRRPARHRVSRRLVVAPSAALMALSALAYSPGAAGAASKVTLTVWNYYTGAEQIAAIKSQDALFEKGNPNVNVEEIFVTFNEMDSRLLASASTHSGPDVVLNNVVVDFPELSDAGVLYNLTKDWDSYPDKSQFPSAGVWTNSKGQIYDVMSYSNLLGLYYNKTILDQYHLTPPATLSQFAADMKVVEAGGKYTPLAAADDPGPDGAWTWFPLLLENGETYCNLTLPKVTQAYQTVYNWAKAGYLPKESATWTQTTSWTEFMSGKYAFGINGNWNLGDAKAATFKWGTTQYPAGPDGSHVFPGGEGLAMGAYTKHAALAWKYIETAWLSEQGGVLDFRYSGQIPIRADVANTSLVKSDSIVAPFVAATKTVSAWPRNPNTSEMQDYVATELSDVVSGQATVQAAAAATVSHIASEIKAGGGGC
jgi:multiple sugar transport system substrate-binding protein